MEMQNVLAEGMNDTPGSLLQSLENQCLRLSGQWCSI